MGGGGGGREEEEEEEVGSGEGVLQMECTGQQPGPNMEVCTFCDNLCFHNIIKVLHQNSIPFRRRSRSGGCQYEPACEALQ